MKFYDYILIVGLFLWAGFGCVVLYFNKNIDIVYTWAITSSIFVINMIAIFYKNRERLEDAKRGLGVQDGT